MCSVLSVRLKKGLRILYCFVKSSLSWIAHCFYISHDVSSYDRYEPAPRLVCISGTFSTTLWAMPSPIFATYCRLPTFFRGGGSTYEPVVWHEPEHMSCLACAFSWKPWYGMNLSTRRILLVFSHAAHLLQVHFPLHCERRHHLSLYGRRAIRPTHSLQFPRRHQEQIRRCVCYDSHACVLSRLYVLHVTSILGKGNLPLWHPIQHTPSREAAGSVDFREDISISFDSTCTLHTNCCCSTACSSVTSR